VSIELSEKPGRTVWFETFCLDRGDTGRVHRPSARV